MASLSFTDRSVLERLFQMSSGWVLDFSNRTIALFVADACGKDFNDSRYDEGSNSKAKRLRKFWDVEPDRVVGLLIDAMAQHAATLTTVDQTLIPNARQIAQRLLQVGSVAELDALAPTGASRTFDALVIQARTSIESDQPEVGIDRLHTFLVSYLRTRCIQHGITTTREDPLHNIFGKYVRQLRTLGLIQSDMADRILRSSISTLDAFNSVRNEQSLAHDNELLGYDESLYIFNHICALVRYIQQIDPPSTSV